MPKRRILLALRPVSPVERLFSVAESLCRRMGDELEVLADPAHPRLDFIRAHLDGLEKAGVACRLTPTAGLNAAKVVGHANHHECVVAVVVGRPRAWAGEGADPWSKLDCPLVAASDLPHLPEEK
ncbi:MAG TPA: hypothetical protein PLL19_14140 [Thiobacillaceae bacterium]|nr:hypothetical protein [Thiobacillaceae bacterium]HNA81787.1 hypothetical protein [Thiobacillaceae bacterium]HNF90471.1 hypothetical protein [Thiobacillaceae bacterium]HNH89880.1 hypothetical protein [Thiobacillaceae bacterium]HNI07979.1 hypothetical protein [Thiobacillaceae bacterium]